MGMFGTIDREMISVGVWHAFSTCIFKRVLSENNIDSNAPRHKTRRQGGLGRAHEHDSKS